MIAITGVSDFSPLAWISWISSAIALIAGQRPQRTELQELTYRCQHPYRWAMEHPLKAIERMFR